MSITSPQWVVLELTAKAEGEDPDVIRASIRHHIRDAEVFVPASVVKRGDTRVYQYLVDGYAFMLHKHPETLYARLEETKYVQGALYTPTGHKKEKRLSTISAVQVEKLRSQIKVEVDQGIDVGDTVVITSGMYKNISAVVREEIIEQEAVVVHIQLRSTDRLLTLPRAFLRLERKAPHVVYRDRFERLVGWVRSAQTLVSWSAPNTTELLSGFRIFVQYSKWMGQITHVYSQLQGYLKQIDFVPLQMKQAQHQLLCAGEQLRSDLIVSFKPLSDITVMISNQLELTYLTNVNSRVSEIYSELKQMEDRKEVPLNIIVDGTQLFIRCSEAPGLGSLADSKGRPTGGIVGFLRSLGSYKKRFPNATFYVCWDGSSQRRKAMYPEYKANRTSRSEGGTISFGWAWLQEFLPLFGVEQAFNPVEEADDVMAALVRGPLKDSPNILLSTDRDLLQLVTEFTHQLCPAMGAGKEKLYDPELVESEYGVPPRTMVHLRALSGDTSDNISGVPNFGLKTASKAIKVYGTVTALLASNLAGLSKGQASNLRASEKQIRLNVELMSLQDVPFRQIRSNPNQTEADARLAELEIKPNSILAAFFPSV